MNSLFHYDGYLNRILTKLMYIVALNLLFLICSIPVITIGASCTAMYTVLFRFVRNDEPDILKTFFKAFRENLKNALVSGRQCWLLQVHWQSIIMLCTIWTGDGQKHCVCFSI